MSKKSNYQVDANRYRKFGGLASMIESYGDGVLNLSTVAKALGFSRETVRADIKKLVGEGGFEKLMERRRESRRRAPQDVWMDVQAAVAHLSQAARKADEASRNESRVLSQTLTEAGEAGVPLRVRLTRKGSMSFALSDGRCVGVRVAVVDDSRQEHRIGFHRFKVTPAVTLCPFTVFALGVGEETLTFVFKSSDISGVRSLNLRYASESKYDITRKSKYDKARGDWSLLKRRK